MYLFPVLSVWLDFFLLRLPSHPPVLGLVQGSLHKCTHRRHGSTSSQVHPSMDHPPSLPSRSALLGSLAVSLTPLVVSKQKSLQRTRSSSLFLLLNTAPGYPASAARYTEKKGPSPEPTNHAPGRFVSDPKPKLFLNRPTLSSSALPHPHFLPLSLSPSHRPVLCLRLSLRLCPVLSCATVRSV